MKLCLVWSMLNWYTTFQTQDPFWSKEISSGVGSSILTALAWNRNQGTTVYSEFYFSVEENRERPQKRLPHHNVEILAQDFWHWGELICLSACLIHMYCHRSRKLTNIRSEPPSRQMQYQRFLLFDTWLCWIQVTYMCYHLHVISIVCRTRDVKNRSFILPHTAPFLKFI